VISPELNWPLDAVEAWARINLPVVSKELVLQREMLISLSREKAPELIDLGVFSYDHRSLSEMPLCRALTRIRIPSGFSLVHGSVLIFETKENRPVRKFAHTFAMQRDTVFCLTPGQFVEFGNPLLNAGARLKNIKERAPHLIRLYNNGLAFLLGNISETRRLLGLEFNVKIN